jgi:hypothetical protein
MTTNKDLLIVLNTFGISHDDRQKTIEYIETLKSIFWHIDKNKLNNRVRVVVSGVLISQECVSTIKETFKEQVSVFTYDYRHPVQISCNKTMIESEKEFNETYNGFFYVSSGLYLPEIQDLFPRIIEKNNSNEYGIIQLQVDSDGGYEWLGKAYDFNNINFNEDYNIPVGNNCNFHVGIINKQLKNFYGVPLSDVHGNCCFETCLSYVSYALRKKYILLGNSECIHFPQNDAHRRMINLSPYPPVPAGLMWGRSKTTFTNDSEGVECGLGYYPGTISNNPIDWNGIILAHNTEKYDNNYFSNDERLRYAVKRCYYTNTNELNYGNIPYHLIK